MWDAIGLFCLGLGGLWGARAGLVRALGTMVAVGVGLSTGVLFGKPMGYVLADVLQVRPLWAAETAGKVLMAFAGGGGTLLLGEAFGLLAQELPLVKWLNRGLGLLVGMGLGALAAVWLGTLVAGQPLLSEVTGRSVLVAVGRRCLELSTVLVDVVLQMLGWK